MKHLLILLSILFSSSIISAQNFGEIAKYEFKTKESYVEAESKVLQCANYLFSNPATSENEMYRLVSIQFILKWMEGTEYTFEIGDKAMELTKGSEDLLGLYLAGMSKVVLDNKGTKLLNDEIYTKTEKLLVDYCSDSANNVKPSKKIKQLMKSK